MRLFSSVTLTDQIVGFCADRAQKPKLRNIVDVKHEEIYGGNLRTVSKGFSANH